MKYSWIIFDADGTLFDYDASECNALTNTFSDFFIPITVDIIKQYRIINTFLFKKFENGDLSIGDLRTKRFSLLFNQLNLEINIDLFSEKYLKYLSNVSQLLPNVENTIATLSKCINMVILTNGIASVQRPRFEVSSIYPFFKDIVISEEEGFSKPSKEIFDITFNRIKNPPKENVLLIGDGFGSDIVGGNNYGIDTCWITDEEESSKRGFATYKIEKFDQILDILGVV